MMASVSIVLITDQEEQWLAASSRRERNLRGKKKPFLINMIRTTT